MAVPKIHEEEFHAFIAHSKVETDFVEMMASYMEDQGVKCSFYEKHFTLGKSLVQNIRENIAKSRRIILVISQSFIDSKWLEFEVAEALHKSQTEDRKNIIYVLYGGVDPENVPHYVKDATPLHYPGDERFFHKLKRQICGEALPLSSAIPAGNVAHGFAWSYYFGFLNIVLPGLPERVLLSEFSHTCNSEILPKLVIILPEDCYCPGSLVEADNALTFEGHIPFNATRAGHINRDYKHSVYSIDTDGKKYLFLAELATPLLSLYDMERSNLTGLSTDQKKHQTKLFIDILREILEWSPWRNSFLLVTYKWSMNKDASEEEDKIPLSRILLRKVAKEIENEKEKIKAKQNISLVESGQEMAEEYDAYIACSDKGAEFGRQLVVDLEEQEMRCLIDERDAVPGMSKVDFICGNFEKSRRIILVVSDDFLDSEWFKIGGHEAINNSMICQKKMIIPLLYGGINPENVPFYVKNVTYTEVPEDPYYLEKIVKGIKDEVTMTSTLPGGNVAQGLAWTYFYGFLELILPGLEERVAKSKFQNTRESRVLPKVFIIMTKDGYCPGSLKDADPAMNFEERINFAVTRAGNIKRDYGTAVYSIEEDGMKYYFLAELCTPLLALYEMRESQLAGLTQEQKDIQRKLFCEKLQEILEHSAYSGRYILLEYKWTLHPEVEETGAETLSQVLLATIKEKLKTLE